MTPSSRPSLFVPLAIAFSGLVFLIARGDSESSANQASESALFSKLELSDQFWSEGANFGDFNNDGEVDLVAGPWWWAGPDFKDRHAFMDDRERSSPAGKSPHLITNADGKEIEEPGFAGPRSGRNEYCDQFQTFVSDFNHDGWEDVMVITFPGSRALWYENPGAAAGGTVEWAVHEAFSMVDNESPVLADLVGDESPELVFHTTPQGAGGSFIGFAQPNPEDPTAAWKFTAISTQGTWQRFTHGLGVGDVDGDGRRDILMSDGWWQQPESLEGDPVWAFHPVPFAERGAQIFTQDVNGDGRADVVTAIDAHGHGLAWYEQRADGSFTRHDIMGTSAETSMGGVHFTQPHAVELADIDGDGLLDIVTGKRYFAHGADGDIDPLGTPVVYAFLLRREGDGQVRYEPVKIDDASGVGTQFAVRDINGDGAQDIAIANKNGIFLFRRLPTVAP